MRQVMTLPPPLRKLAAVSHEACASLPKRFHVTPLPLVDVVLKPAVLSWRGEGLDEQEPPRGQALAQEALHQLRQS